MPTLILTHRYSPDTQLLWRAALEAGWGVQRVGWGYDGSDKPTEPVLYGESLLMAHVADKLGITLLDPQDDWMAATAAGDWGYATTAYFNREIMLQSLEEAKGLVGPTFVKPAGGKAFPARVYSNGKELARETVGYADNTRVTISTPVRFRVEYRCFMLDWKVETISVYIRDGALAQDGESWPCDAKEMADARAFANEFGYKMRPGWTDGRGQLPAHMPPAVVLDVGLIEQYDGKCVWSVVETNACWASGLCGCDPSAVLKVLQRAVINPHNAGDDARWIRGYS